MTRPRESKVWVVVKPKPPVPGATVVLVRLPLASYSYFSTGAGDTGGVGRLCACAMPPSKTSEAAQAACRVMRVVIMACP